MFALLEELLPECGVVEVAGGAGPGSSFMLRTVFGIGTIDLEVISLQLLPILLRVLVRELYLVLFDTDVPLLEELAERGWLLLARGSRLLRDLWLDLIHSAVRGGARVFSNGGGVRVLKIVLRWVEVVDLLLWPLELLDLVRHG